MNQQGTFSFLIAEDEPRIRKNLIKKITAFDPRFYLLNEAKNGSEALDFIEKEQPDILFTDIRMPVTDGLKLIEEVYYNYPDVLTVIISGYDDFSYAQKAIRFEVLGYLLKPVENDNLKGTLGKITARLEDRKESLESEAYPSGLAQEELAAGVADYIKAGYKGEISIVELAEKFHVNPTYMTRVFKSVFNKTPTKYILELRISQAKKIMREQPELEMKEISYKLGYNDQGYFSRIFKKITGLSPSEYKESL